jgi:hypothetical protein
VRDDLDADQIGHTLWAAVLGSHQHCGATGEDLSTRLADVHAIILPAICTPEALRSTAMWSTGSWNSVVPPITR